MQVSTVAAPWTSPCGAMPAPPRSASPVTVCLHDGSRPSGCEVAPHCGLICTLR